MQQIIRVIFTISLFSLTFFSFAAKTHKSFKSNLKNNFDTKLQKGETLKSIKSTDWQSIQTQIMQNHQARQYHVYSKGDGNHQSSNPAHGWQIEYSRDGTTRISSQHKSQSVYNIGLRLIDISYGPDDSGFASVPKQPQHISINEQRLNYHWDNNITEYWINSKAQLEQWFEIKQRPKSNSKHHSEHAPLVVNMTLDTTLPVTLENNHLKIGMINYDKLKVWDVRGTIIPATMAYHNQQLRLIIDDTQAQYPLTIDPSFSQSAYLKASNPGINDQFGASIAISGDTLVVGAPSEDFSGAAYVFVRNGTTWSQQAYLKASNAEFDDFFGSIVSISGDTIVIGAEGEDSDSIGVDGVQTNNSADFSGAAYVFVRNGTTWTQQAYLKASNTEADDLFGTSVSISGDTIVIGARGEGSNSDLVNGNQTNNSADFSGAAYVFLRSGTTWSQQAYLKASNSDANDNFGYSVSISGDTIVVGAFGEASLATGVGGDGSINSASDSGAAYVFVRSGTSWSQQSYLKATNSAAGDSFGISVSISGDTLVVGASFEDSAATGVYGNEALNSAIQSGAAYVFVRNGVTWFRQAYLKASNTDANDRFGESVSISGDIIIVGASFEDSAATGVNGDGSVNSAGNSGAAYVFVRDDTDVWSPPSYHKASNTESGDSFGFSVAASNNTVFIGARNEDSNAIGVNGDEANNSASSSGAVYVYEINYFIGGTVSGLASGNSVVIQNNSGDDLNINTNGDFTFTTALNNDSVYDVTVLTQPTLPNQTCAVSAGSGLLVGANVTNVTVNCITDTYTVGGSVSGLTAGKSVVLQNNGSDIR